MKKATLIFVATLGMLYAGAQNPPAKRVIADYLKTIGGEMVLKNIKTIRVSAEEDLMASGMASVSREGKPDTTLPVTAKVGKVLIEQEQMAPNKFLKTAVSNSSQVRYNFKMVFDGTSGFIMQNGIQSSMPGAVATRLKEEKGPIPQMQYLSDPTIKMTNVGMEQLDGKDCYKIQVYYPDGGGSLTEYYNVQSKLLTRRVDSSLTPVQVVDYSDYKMVDHVLFSYKQVITLGKDNPTQEQRVTDIQLNNGVSESDFASGKKK